MASYDIDGLRIGADDYNFKRPSSAWNDITGKPSTFPPSAHNHNASNITSGTLGAGRLPSDAMIRTSPTHVVSNGVDLNASDYLVVGTYFSESVANTFKNSALQGAWMMIVIAPLGGEETPRTKAQIDSAQWVYRVRYQIAYSTGELYAQAVSSGATAGQYSYGSWKKIAMLSDIPTSLPANGGNSSTVNGHSVNSDVPANAKFTDTDTHKTWGLSISGHTVSIVDGGTNKSVTVPDNNTTYDLSPYMKSADYSESTEAEAKSCVTDVF